MCPSIRGYAFAGLVAFLCFAAPVFPVFAQADIEFSIGKSVQGRDIQVKRFGTGRSALVLTGGMHGSFEGNTIDVVKRVAAELLPTIGLDGLTVFVIENLNPDAVANTPRKATHADGTVLRFNSRAVDLNRNWDTPDWKAAQNYHGESLYPKAGGTKPFSEPETRSLAAFLVALRAEYKALTVVNYHSFAYQDRGQGAVYPGYARNKAHRVVLHSNSVVLSQVYAKASSYTIEKAFDEYDVPGEFVHWAALRGISSFDVELSDFNGIDRKSAGRDSHIEATKKGLSALIRHLSSASLLKDRVDGSPVWE